LNTLNEEFHINGKNMISKRITESKQILKQLNKKAFISGSFLYAKNYNDIDIYIISKKRKQYHKGNKHFIFITESDLKFPLFASVSQYSIANFEIPNYKIHKKRALLDENILSYQISIKEILENETPDSLKYLILEYHLIIKNKLLDSYELSQEHKKIIQSKNNIKKINSMLKEIILHSHSKRYVYDTFVKFTKKLDKDIKTYSNNKNLIIYKQLFDEIKNECRTTKT